MKKGIWIIVAALLSLGAIIGANALVSTTNVNTLKKCSGCNRRTCQTICGTTPHRQRQPSGDYR